MLTSGYSPFMRIELPSPSWADVHRAQDDAHTLTLPALAHVLPQLQLQLQVREGGAGATVAVAIAAAPSQAVTLTL